MSRDPACVYIVMRDFPYIYTEIERVFLNEDRAHHFITDSYPYLAYYSEQDFYAMEGLKEPIEFEDEERYYVLTKPIADFL